MYRFLRFLILILLTGSYYVEAKTALVKKVRGTASLINKDGSKSQIKEEQWLDEGDKVVTAEKSFVRLVFLDKTAVNIGPDSQMDIKVHEKGKPAVLDLIKGQVRAQVVKDPLSHDKDKLLIRTKTAAMGVRGTDFHVTSYKDTTSVVTYEGSVAMVQTENGKLPELQNLQEALRSQTAVLVTQGTYSATSQEFQRVNQPVRISPAQLNTLKGNQDLSESKEKFAAKSDTKRAVTPPGISAKIANSDMSEKKTGDFFASEKGAVGKGPASVVENSGGKSPEGFVDAKTKAHAPTAGGFVDLKTGKYIEPPKNAQYDPQTGTYIVPKEQGQIDPKTGTFLAPKPEDTRQPGSDNLAKGPEFFGGGIYVAPPPEKGELLPPPPPGGIEGDGTGSGLSGELAEIDLGDIAPCEGGDISNCQSFQNPTGSTGPVLNITKVKFQVVVEDQ